MEARSVLPLLGLRCFQSDAVLEGKARVRSFRCDCASGGWIRDLLAGWRHRTIPVALPCAFCRAGLLTRKRKVSPAPQVRVRRVRYDNDGFKSHGPGEAGSSSTRASCHRKAEGSATATEIWEPGGYSQSNGRGMGSTMDVPF